MIITIKDENDKFVALRNVAVTINGKTKVIKTDANGVAKFSTNGLAPNTYSASIAFDGDGTYAKSNTTSKVIVNKAASKITAKKKTFKRSKKVKKYKITLKSGKNPIKNVKVTIKIGKKTYKAKTNYKGIAKVTINSDVLKKLKVGKNIFYQASYGKYHDKKIAKVYK